MRLQLAYPITFLGIGLFLLAQTLPSVHAGSQQVAIANIDGAIDPVSARYLSRVIDQATADRAQLVVVELNTPGGLLSSTRDMVGDLLSARIPVAVYVSPPGAQAASAGTFITAAADFAVMAPGTNIGAASPVASGGEEIPPTLAKKINQDTQAFIRSIAAARNRNPQALEATVTHARAYSAGEAVELQVVDFTARDLADLLTQLDGQTAQTAAGPVLLQTRDADVRELKPSLLENFLNVLANPNLAFVLLVIGGLGILVEFLTPGVTAPGVIGVIALALAFLGLGHLPVNWVGVGLIIFSMVLFFLEAQHSGLGVFGIGGVICLVLGGFLLFGGFISPPDINEPSFRVSWWIIGVIGGAMAAFLLGFLYLARPTGALTGYALGSEAALVGQQGVAISDLAPVGRVRLADQEWTATSDLTELIPQGTAVRVLGVYGSVLKVSGALPEDTAGGRALLDKLFRKRRERELQEASEARQREPGETEGADLPELPAILQRGFSSINSPQGLKALEQLTDEYEQLQPVLDRRKETDPTSGTYIPALVEETYRQGLSGLANALQLLQAIGSSDRDHLEAEIAELEREIEALKEDQAPAKPVRLREETIASHQELLDLIRKQRLRVDELLHQADRCKASLHRARVELAALQADSAETNVTMVTEALRRTIDRAREVQEELKRLGS